MKKVYELVSFYKNIMLKMFTTNKNILDIKILESFIFFFKVKKLNFFFFSIEVIGRIFQWTHYENFIDFNLPLSNKPKLFLLNPTFVICPKNKKIFFTNINFNDNNFILTKLLSIKKPSIFNIRGFIIISKVIYKKRGKVTNYVTNK